MVADRESLPGSLEYGRDNAANAALIDDGVAPVVATVGTGRMAARSTTKTTPIV